MRLHVIMIMRNETERHLERSLACARDVVHLSGGKLLVTDDASTDDSVKMASGYGAIVNRFKEPLFWTHEGRARQAHLDFVDRHVTEGDFVLSLDADETINDPEMAVHLAQRAYKAGSVAVFIPLFEFWQEDPPMYRTDGFWFGTNATRLFRWIKEPVIKDRQFAPGSEPIHVALGVRRRKYIRQNKLHLLHWGYSREIDRKKKYIAYTSRDGGHAHNDKHIQSIITEPELRPYSGVV